MAPGLTYSLADYPPDADTIQAAREQAALESRKADLLKLQPLLQRENLYVVIERLINDTSPQNTFRHSVYASTTGGGSSSKPLFFATDVLENRRHRAYFGQFLRTTKLIKHGDWVLTTHCAGDLYRSLDLTLELMENAGASALAAGDSVSPARVAQLLADYHVNVLSGDGSHVIQMVHHISTLPAEERDKIKLYKIIYTSEGLTKAQSAEAGPYAVSNPDLTSEDPDSVSSHEDFIFDTRVTLIEILPLSFPDDCIPDTVSDGDSGVIAQTSLTRLRNPVVRYLTGDVGSLHPLPEKAKAQISKEHWPYLRILRLRGRDRRFSFQWDGEYIEFENLTSLMSDEIPGILQWQVILDKMEPSKEASLEVRILCSQTNAKDLPNQAIVDQIKVFFHVYSSNQHRFSLKFVNDRTGFELSKAGQKVVKCIDRYH